MTKKEFIDRWLPVNESKLFQNDFIRDVESISDLPEQSDIGFRIRQSYENGVLVGLSEPITDEQFEKELEKRTPTGIEISGYIANNDCHGIIAYTQWFTDQLLKGESK